MPQFALPIEVGYAIAYGGVAVIASAFILLIVWHALKSWFQKCVQDAVIRALLSANRLAAAVNETRRKPNMHLDVGSIHLNGGSLISIFLIISIVVVLAWQYIWKSITGRTERH